MTMEKKIKLRILNNYITCRICRGYLIDATTVTECLHTCKFQDRVSLDLLYIRIFLVCKSCLVKHLEENNNCPSCQIVIHQSHPLQYISFDRTMQDIVYKLVPDLQKSKLLSKCLCFLMLNYNFNADELETEREFYKVRGLPNPKDVPPASGDYNGEHEPDPHAESDYHRQDEQINVCLECISSSLRTLRRRFIRCSAQATILHLKKFIAMKVLNGMERYRDIDILCNEELLGKDHTLKFVYVTRWRFLNPPLTLQYRPRIDI